MTIEVYTFETDGDAPASDYRTQDINEARQYARQHRFSLIANQYEWADSELLEDYR